MSGRTARSPLIGSTGAEPLGALPVGASAVIRDVRGPRHLVRRLLELGLLPGTPVEVVRTAPLGDPIELRVRGTSLSLRRVEANDISVEPMARGAARLAEAAE